MEHLNNGLKVLLVFSCLAFSSVGEAKTSNLTLKKNHVADFLFLTDREDGKPHKKQYFADIAPPAIEMGYQNTTAFLIKRHPISGHYFPRVLAVASWPGDWQQRQALFAQLLEKRPDIQSRRFDIWSTFNMVNYEIEEDIDIEFDPNKIYVFGAYWKKNDDTFDGIKNEMLSNIKQAGGKVNFKVGAAHTLFGYVDAPDFSIITEWETQDAFDQYYEQAGLKQQQAVKYSSELYLHIRG